MGAIASATECAQCSCKRDAESVKANDVQDDPEVSPDFDCDSPLSPQQSHALHSDLDAQLVEATRQSDAELVKSLLSQKASVATRDLKSGWTLLHIAASEGCLALVPVLLQRRASPNRKDGEGRTPLLVATERQHSEFAVLLAEALKPKEREALGKRLMEVSSRGHLEEAQILLKCSAPADSKDREGKSALHFAASVGNLPLARLLLASGARRDAKTKIGRTPLEEAARAGQLRIVAWLVDRGARVKSGEREALGENLLVAAGDGRLDDVKTLLTYDANIDAKTKDGSTALVLAAENGHLPVGEFLNQTATVKGGVVQGDREKLGLMLINAVVQGDLERAQLMLKFGARASCTDVWNESPLWKAAIDGRADIAEFLLKQRAELEVRSRNCRRTPLVVAIDRGKAEVVELLLARRAELPEPNVLGRKLRDSAFNGEVPRLRMLLRVRADVHSAETGSTVVLHGAIVLRGKRKDGTEVPPETHSTEATGETALHRAVAGGRLETAKLLLAGAADVDSKAGKPGRTALFAAAANKNAEMVQLLLGSGANHRGRDKDGFRNAQEFLKSVAN